MPTHDIIDNRHEILFQHINRILSSTEKAKFAVGYFFLSGLKSIQDHLSHIAEIRLLIGNTTNRKTLEQISEGYKRLELVERAAEEMRYLKRSEQQLMIKETTENIRQVIEVMDQTDGDETILKTVSRLIEEKRLKVRVYTKGRLHAKAYIFDYRQDGRYEQGIAIVGSSNLTLAGVAHNTELNVVVHGNDNHAELTRWFEELWQEARDFDETLFHELNQSWALSPVRPYDIYMKTIYTLVKDRLEEKDTGELLWEDDITNQLADFQKVAVRQAIQMIRDYGGAFVADVVGVGKSFIGAAIVKHFEKTEHVRPVIICPAPLVEMWENYNEIYQLNARVLSMGFLRKSGELGANWMLEDRKYRDRNFVLVDESHNFRHHTTQRYEVLQAFVSAGRKRCIFLTATPRNKTAWDIYHQIKLFNPDDKSDLPIDPQNLKDYFQAIEAGERQLQNLLPYMLIRRTRQHILKWFGLDSETNEPINPAEFDQYLDGKKHAYILVGGRHQYFPRRELETIEYSIEATYQGLYQRIRSYLGRSKVEPREQKGNKDCRMLKYARYGLWHYVIQNKQRVSPYNELKRAGANIRGLIRILLFKRLESSVYAFAETIRRLISIHEGFLAALERGIVPAGDDAQKILYESDAMDDVDLFDALEQASEKYAIQDFEADQLRSDIEHDIGLLNEILKLVTPITQEHDMKLQTLVKKLQAPPLRQGKVLIFTQYADTAWYLAQYLEKKLCHRVVDYIFSSDKSKARVVGRFAPRANPEYRFARGETEIEVLVATDVLAEGLNLQDCDKVINYDLHWNPVRLIQRFGRIDRIGSEYEAIWAYNFLPETELERNLGIKEKLQQRIKEIHETIGEDSAILDKSEQLNEEAMYAIYDKQGARLYQFEDETDLIDLNEAEEFLRQLRKDNPAEFERIANLRDGIRSAKLSDINGTFVFCQAGRFQQLFLADSAGEIISREIPKILSIIRCAREEPSQKFPEGYNRLVMKIKQKFNEEVKHRAAERDYTISLTRGQKYVLRELRLYFQQIDDDDQKAQINILEKAFRQPLNVAVNRELNTLRGNGVIGIALVKNLTRIYYQHNLRERLDQPNLMSDQTIVPRIICSEGLV